MIYPVRQTLTGTEYWDTEAKRIVTEKPKPEPKQLEPDLDGMKLSELAGYAKTSGIGIPKGVTKRQDIIDFLKANG